MASWRQITCINKSNRTDPHDRITHVGGSGWKVTQPQAISDINNGTWSYYVSVSGQSVEVIVAERNGNKYLKTKNDGEQPNNLLSLPEC